MVRKLVCSKCGRVEKSDPLMSWHADGQGVITCGPCHEGCSEGLYQAMRLPPVFNVPDYGCWLRKFWLRSAKRIRRWGMRSDNGYLTVACSELAYHIEDAVAKTVPAYVGERMVRAMIHGLRTTLGDVKLKSMFLSRAEGEDLERLGSLMGFEPGTTREEMLEAIENPYAGQKPVGVA